MQHEIKKLNALKHHVVRIVEIDGKLVTVGSVFVGKLEDCQTFCDEIAFKLKS